MTEIVMEHHRRSDRPGSHATCPAHVSIAAEKRFFPSKTSEEAPESARVGKAFDQHTWEVLGALARTVDASSPWTADHSKRVTGLAIAIGGAVGLSLEQLATLYCAALLHDIGKVGVSTNILDKPGELTSNEFESMEEHPAKGARILEPLSAYAPVVPIVLQHHERLDGSGYPYGLRGEAICPGARILAVADVYDALISERPYRASWNHQRAMAFIKERTDRIFDPRIVEVFLDIMIREDSTAEPDTEDSTAEPDTSERVLDMAPPGGSFRLIHSRSAS